MRGAVQGLFGRFRGATRNMKIYLTKLYVGTSGPTLTKRRFKYVNTEIFSGKLLSTAVEKTTTSTTIRGKTTPSHAIDAM